MERMARGQTGHGSDKLRRAESKYEVMQKDGRIERSEKINRHRRAPPSENTQRCKDITGLRGEDVEDIWTQFICHLIICLQLAAPALHLAALPAAQLALQSLSASLSITRALMCAKRSNMCVCVWLRAHMCLFHPTRGARKRVMSGAFWEDLWSYCRSSITGWQTRRAIWPTNKALLHNCSRGTWITFVPPSVIVFHMYLHVVARMLTGLITRVRFKSHRREFKD